MANIQTIFILELLTLYIPFPFTESCFVEITEGRCKIVDVIRAVAEACPDDMDAADLSLVDVNGIELVDCRATRGKLKANIVSSLSYRFPGEIWKV